MSDIPVPILYLSGEQGAEKTTMAKIIVQVVDPSTVPVRAAPSHVEQWVVSATGVAS